MDQKYLSSFPTINPARGFYELNYDLSAFYLLEGDVKIFVGPDKNRTCRFCRGREGVNATFRTMAHAIPEMLGNSSLFTNYECDSCNSYFGRTIEHHLGAYLKPYRTLAAIAGKRGFPKIINGPEGWSIIPREDGIDIEHSGASDIFEVDRDNRTVRLKLVRDPYVPANVYKALLKMAISIAPEEHADTLRDIARWVRYGDCLDVKSCDVSLTFVEGWRPIRSLTTLMLTRKYSGRNLPYMFYILSFANLSFQIAVPCMSEDLHIIGTKVRFPSFPTPYQFGEVRRPVGYRTLDLSGTEKVSGEEEHFKFDFESVHLVSERNEDQ